MDAFARALTDGATTVECDLRLTADRQWIMHHDADCVLAGVTLRIADLNLNDLQQAAHTAGIDAPPTLSQFLAWAQSSGINPILDIKDTQGLTELIATIDRPGISINFYTCVYSAGICGSE